MIITTLILVSVLTAVLVYAVLKLQEKSDAQAMHIATLLKNEQVLVQNQETLQKDLTRLFNEFKSIQKEINRK